MSGYGRNGRAQELLDGGVAAFVQKPFAAADLGEAIAQASTVAAAARRARRKPMADDADLDRRLRYTASCPVTPMGH
jgi:FixJ family two-component response regulator